MKRFLLSLSLIVFASSVHAAYLNWQVNNDPGGSTGLGALNDDWNKANLMRYDSDTKTATIVESQDRIGSKGGHIYTYTDNDSVDGVFDNSKYSYYIELVNSTGNVRGESKKVTYSQLAGSVTGSLEDVPLMTVWHGGTFGVPEPTSAVLMLLGVAGLALRRKQRNAA